MKRRKPLTNAELNGIVEDYAHSMPGWRRVSVETLARVDGPILQDIGFERLSGGDYYRPIHSIQVLVAPTSEGRRGRADFCYQMPETGPRTASRRSHAVLWPKILESMKREVIPAIDEPLNAMEVLDLCEVQAVPRSAEAFALAPLHAWYGNDDRARHWCSQHAMLLESWPYALQDYQLTQRQFLDWLRTQLEAGTAQASLQLILEEERRKWGP